MIELAAPKSDIRKHTKSRKSARSSGLGFTILASFLALVSLGLFVYPSAAQWLSNHNQTLITSTYNADIQNASPNASAQLAAAELYNSQLSAGAEFAPMANVASGVGTSEELEDTYWKQLVTQNSVMSRIQIEKIGVDLPIYHGTSDQTLLNGAGHLQGTSLPVGGAPGHSVITAHRGLAESRMFTDLDQIKVDDTFVITTFGRVLSYKVIETKVVEPSDTASLRQVEGQDLVTLVTCTPLGINSQRILVTAERTTPTPPADEELSAHSGGAGFPWWAVVLFAGLVAVSTYFVLRLRSHRQERSSTTAQHK